MHRCFSPSLFLSYLCVLKCVRTYMVGTVRYTYIHLFRRGSANKCKCIHETNARMGVCEKIAPRFVFVLVFFSLPFRILCLKSRMTGRNCPFGIIGTYFLKKQLGRPKKSKRNKIWRALTGVFAIIIIQLSLIFSILGMCYKIYQLLYP